jgi:hypothetical protein
MAVSDQDAYRSDHTLSFVFGYKTLGKPAIVAMAKGDSTQGAVSSCHCDYGGSAKCCDAKKQKRGHGQTCTDLGR